jgi:hypothetical protein
MTYSKLQLFILFINLYLLFINKNTLSLCQTSSLKILRMKTSTKQILKVMNVLSWIIFIGLCIRTGAIIYSFFVSLFFDPVSAKDLYVGLNLSDIKEFDTMHYLTLVLLIIFLSTLKALLFYRVIKIFMKINFVQPFSTEVVQLITKISYIALTIGMLTIAAACYALWLSGKGVVLKTLLSYLGGGPEFLFLAAIVFVISLVFKRGIEIQSENELTV